MTPYPALPVSPIAMLRSVWRHRRLVWQLTRRDVVGRYRGSIMGLLWSFLNPLVMLGVYTLVFSVVFEFRWGGGPRGTADFACMLFAGMIVHGLFAECAMRAPTLILANRSLVKRVVFPLEILPCVAIGSALFHAAVGLVVLLLFAGGATWQAHWSWLAMPLVLIPLVLFTAGCAWFLASIGVYVRDVGHSIGLVVMMSLFLSPVIYPLSAVPEAYRAWLYANPLTFFIEQTRAAALARGAIDWSGLPLALAGGFAIASLGFAWFQKTRRGFADVL